MDYGNPKPCVAVLVEEAGRLLLGRRAVAPAQGQWDILGGFIEAGETAEDAARREVLEETSLRVALTRYLGTFPDVYGPRRLPTLNLGFVAQRTAGSLSPASDVAELRWFLSSELPQCLAFPHQFQMIEAWRRAGPGLPPA
jgi:ADP-ribose pyrophosphatase YjhB (NUDIX family)